MRLHRRAVLAYCWEAPFLARIAQARDTAPAAPQAHPLSRRLRHQLRHRRERIWSARAWAVLLLFTQRSVSCLVPPYTEEATPPTGEVGGVSAFRALSGGKPRSFKETALAGVGCRHAML